MKKGFTLIELLAVIVILAIIALIATPIVLNIINDARDSANERSVEFYGEAIEQAVATKMLTSPVQSGEYQSSEDGKTITKGSIEIKVNYSGSRVKCSQIYINNNGTIYLSGCKVGNETKEYTYGERGTQRYYSWLSGTVGGDLPEDAKTDPSQLTTNNGYDYYLGFDVDNKNKVIAAYVCFVRNNKQYCLKGYDESAYSNNQDIIREAFKDIADTDACSFDSDFSSCNTDDLYADASPNGYVNASGYAQCYVEDKDSNRFGCGG